MIWLASPPTCRHKSRKIRYWCWLHEDGVETLVERGLNYLGGLIGPPSGMSLLRVLLPALFISFILLFSYTYHIAVPGGNMVSVGKRAIRG